MDEDREPAGAQWDDDPHGGGASHHRAPTAAPFAWAQVDEVSREVAAAATWGLADDGDTRVIPAALGADGEVLDIGRSTLTEPTGIRRALTVRDRG